MNVVRMAGVTKRYRDVLALDGVSLALAEKWWPAVGSFFGTQPSLTLLVTYPLVIALGAGGVGWLALRRAVA